MPRGRRWRVGAVLILTVVLAACDSPKPSPQGSGGPAESPGDSGGPSAEPSGTLPQPTPGATPAAAGEPGLVLSEIGFAHGTESAFIELWNAGPAALDLRDAGLELDGSMMPFTAPVVPLPADGRFLIRFDYVLGEEPAAGAAHLPPEGAPKVGGGSLDLLDPYGQPADHVAWGSQPDAVRTGLGGLVPDALAADWTIGRAPGATAVTDRLAWVPYGAGLGTPGAPNPLPAVPVLLPFSGALFETTTAELDWYPSPGAEAYRIQVATDATFGSVVHEETVPLGGLDIQNLAPGSYAWRIQAIGPDALASPFSEPATFDVDAASAGVTTALANPGQGSVALAAVEPDAAKDVNAPLLTQHKDSELLTLERNERQGPHPWDLDHGALDQNDPADNMNCGLASTAMLAAFACPLCHMTQDRIGYEIFKGRMPGPERDFNYGDGLSASQVTDAISFALVAAGAVQTFETVPDRVWSTMRQQIDAGRPLVVARTHATGGHVFVITGYRVRAGVRTIFANDPWSGLKTYTLATSGVADPADPGWYMWPTSGPLLGRQQEHSVSDDSDDDGVKDFDETERFHTDPNEVDTDDDGVNDKQDIASSVFDPQYGYAVTYNKDVAIPRMDGRDFDRDGLPNERDPDSDQGGCKDGEEDKNLDGLRNPGETWNFLAADDPCRPLSGSLYYVSKYSVGSDESWQRTTETFDLSLRLKPDPSDPRRVFLDDGSTYSYVSHASGYVQGLAGCDDNVSINRTGGGTFAPSDLNAGVVTEYEPGQDGLGIGVSAPWRGSGQHTNCLISETLTDTGVFGGSDFCFGLEDPDDGVPAHTFVFNCGENLGVGWFGRSWSLTGTVVLQ